MPTFPFPKDFVWGCAAASYQIEGAHDVDGKGRSIWDAFCEQPGRIKEGHSGRVACDHYHRWADDLDLMKSLGMQSYRFSISWPRIFPEGRGKVNEKGLAFYDRLIDGMLERGITPALTCYHWDMPEVLEVNEGGWQSRSVSEAFADYVAVIAKRYGDRVPMWFTINEIPVIYIMGYGTEEHAPGVKGTEKVKRQVAHNLLRGHGLAAQAIRANAPKPVKLGLVNNVYPHLPFFDSEEHISAARKAYDESNSWLLGPVFHGKYPEKEWMALGDSVPDVKDGDLKTINEPTDFLGLNLYQAPDVVHAEHGVCPREPWFPRTDFGWAITPDCIYWSARFTEDLYKPKAMYITENGCCYPDQMNRHGRVEDHARIEYLRGHLRSLHRAIDDGLPMKGYYLWSVMDNFEWAQGFTKRFGIVHVNYDTLKRTPKLSAEWYASVIRNGGL